MPKYPNNRIFMGFGEKKRFFYEFLPLLQYSDVEAMGQKIDQYHFGRIWRLSIEKIMIPLFLCNSASNFQRKSQKIENNDNQIFYFIFCIFLKNRRVELSFQCRNEFYMPKYPNNRIFMGFGEKSVFSPNFCPYYSMAMWRLWSKKLINTISAEFGIFPSKKHDPIVFMQFCQ